ncbi:MAG: TldD/PmbA family protein [Chloroflexi bacterium]|nr:TldD/PmbA family protein [Chloroflexota bacterium]
MSDLTPLAIAQRLVEKARAAGADEADAMAIRSTDSEATVRLQEVEKVIEASSRGVGLRVIVGGRQALVSTSDLGETALDESVANAMALAELAEPDEHAGLPDPADQMRTAAELQLYDESIEAISGKERIARAMACEQAALAVDDRITNSDGATFATRLAEVALADSNGFAGSYVGSSVSLAVEVMAEEEDGRLKNDYWQTSERQLHRLADAESVGREAAARALRQLGASKRATTRVPVVWEPRLAAGFAGVVARACSGEAFFRRSTFLAELQGEAVASSLVTIVDDPTLSGRLGSRPFDGEGIGSRRNVLFQEGVFEGFLFDTYNARRTGKSSTGSATRSVTSLPQVGNGNLTLEAGERDPASIVGEVEDGLYLTTLMGFGINFTTGDFSRGAAGLWIRNGELAEPVTEINVSGNMREMLSSIDAVGSDVEWFGGAAAPTIRMSELTVSGT